MSITSGQRSMCLELMQKMAYASSEAEYDTLYTQPLDCEWVLVLKFVGGSFLNTTNNRLESINGKHSKLASSVKEIVENGVLFTTETSEGQRTVSLIGGSRGGGGA